MPDPTPALQPLVSDDLGEARPKRISATFNWASVNLPRLWPCDPCDGRILVVLDWGNGRSDPVWSVGVWLDGVIAKPFIAWANHRWDKAYRKQEARRG